MKKKKYPNLPERSHPDYMRLYNEMHKESLSEKRKEKYKNKRDECLALNPNYFKEKYDPIAAAEWRENNRNRMMEWGWKRRGINNFTYDQFTQMLFEQKNKCKICECDLIKTNLDHDHTTGEVRGILCPNCNLSLGIYENNRDRFEKYLNEHHMRKK